MQRLTKNWRTRFQRIVSGRLAIAMAIACLFFAATLPALPVHAAQITARKVTLSSSAASATGVTYTFNFTVPTTGTPVKSLDILLCTTASGTCTGSSGTTTGGSLSSQPTGLGAASGWTGTFTTNNRLQVANSSNATNPAGAVTLVFGGITNPTTANTSFYARITTYSDASWTTTIDAGAVAAATANQITVSATVPESLTFCTGTSGITSSSCASATGTSVSLGVLTTSSTGSGTSQIGVNFRSKHNCSPGIADWLSPRLSPIRHEFTRQYHPHYWERPGRRWYGRTNQQLQYRQQFYVQQY